MPDKLMLRALNGQVTERPPIWLMRQAGRYLPEYRSVRQKTGGFLDLCYDPARAEEVTLQPIRRFDFDAAILFSDILVVPDALGSDVGFYEGEGPRLTPLAHRSDLARLSTEKLHSHLAPVYETLRRLHRSLPEDVTLIGFSGAPWTLAAYMVEGGGSKEYAVARKLARAERRLFGDLIDLLCQGHRSLLRSPGPEWRRGDPALRQLGRRVATGREGALGHRAADQNRHRAAEPLPGRADYRLSARCRSGARRCGRQRQAQRCRHRYRDRPDLGGAGACRQTSACRAISIPLSLVAGGDGMCRAADRILDAWDGRPFIFNLGHGVVPETPPEHVAQLLQHLKSREK